MLSEQSKDRIIEVVIVVQMSAILIVLMFYYFIHPPQEQSPCPAKQASQYLINK